MIHRLGVVGIALLGAVGCTSRPQASERTPTGGVEIRLQAATGLPALRMKVAFFQNVDPSGHVQPLAATLVGVRSRCFEHLAPNDEAAVAAIEVRAGTIHATSRNAAGKCFATAIDGKPIADPTDVMVEVQVSPDSAAPTSKS